MIILDSVGDVRGAMVSDGAAWYQMVPHGIRWCRMVSGDDGYGETVSDRENRMPDGVH